MSKYKNQFIYSDMICQCLDFNIKGLGSILFRVLLPKDAPLERFVDECGRIPRDNLFKFLIANHYGCTVYDVKANLYIDENGLYSQLLVRCLVHDCADVFEAYDSEYDLFCHSKENRNCLMTDSFIDTSPVLQDGDSGNDTIDGIFHVSYQLFRSGIWDNPTVNHALAPFGIDFRITCLNADIFEEYHKHAAFDLQAAMFRILYDVLMKCANLYITNRFSLLFMTQKMVTHVRWDYISIDEGNAYQYAFNMFIVGDIDCIYQYQFTDVTPSFIVCRPVHLADTNNTSRIIPVPIDKFCSRAIDTSWDWSGATAIFENMQSALFNTDTITYVPTLISKHEIVVDSESYIKLNFVPHWISYTNGFCNNDDVAFIIVDRGYLKLAFQFRGTRLRKGVLAYGQFDASEPSNFDWKTFCSIDGAYGNIKIKIISAYSTIIHFMLIDTHTYPKMDVTSDLSQFFPEMPYVTLSLQDFPDGKEYTINSAIKELVKCIAYNASNIEQCISLNGKITSDDQKLTIGDIVHMWGNMHLDNPELKIAFLSTCVDFQLFTKKDEYVIENDNRVKKSMLKRIIDRCKGTRHRR